MCLTGRDGNTVACDALIRVLERQRAAETAMKKEAAKMLPAGVSKRDVVQWAMDRGFVGSQLSDAVGISLKDLQADSTERFSFGTSAAGRKTTTDTTSMPSF